ncbi:MAG: hypothetical protein AB7F65_04275 [Dehalococcoidia bacterium]
MQDGHRRHRATSSLALRRGDRRSRARLAPLLAAAVAILGFAWGAAPAVGQSDAAEWTLAPLGLFGDERVELAMRLQIDAEAAAATAGVALSYFGSTEAPAGNAADLLAAAGVAAPGQAAEGLVIERPCRTWAADETLAPVATALGAELSEAWATYEVGFPPCGQTDDPALADILVFPAGEPPAGIDLQTPRGAGSFLGFARPVQEGATPGTGGGEPTPAEGGSLGEAQETGAVEVAVALAAAAVVLGGGRLLSGRVAR